MATRNQINLKTLASSYEESIASGICKPGHLLKLDSDNKVLVHDAYGGAGELLVCRSDTLQGGLVTGSYAVDALVPYNVAAPGDVFQMRIPAGAAAIVVGDDLISDGLGGLIKPPVTPGLLYDAVAASAAITATDTETAFDKSYTFPANSLKVGDIIRVRAQVIATATNSTDTLTLKAYLAAIQLQTTGAVDVANNDIGYIEFDLVIRTIGSSGTFVGTGIQGLGVPGTVTGKPFLLASSAINTTTTNALTVKATWSTTNAGNSCRLDVLNVQLIRSGTFKKIFKALEAVDNSSGSADVFIPVRALAG